MITILGSSVYIFTVNGGPAFLRGRGLALVTTGRGLATGASNRTFGGGACAILIGLGSGRSMAISAAATAAGAAIHGQIAFLPECTLPKTSVRTAVNSAASSGEDRNCFSAA